LVQLCAEIDEAARQQARHQAPMDENYSTDVGNHMLDQVAGVFGRYDPNLHQNCTVYKVRAEVPRDVIMGFLSHTLAGTDACTKIVTIDYAPIVFAPTVTFASTLTLDELRSAWKKVDDLHVMIDTVANIEDYTGERF
jgi:hypothetical protein